MDFALLYDGKKCISAWGAYESSAQKKENSFWINDFQLSDLNPWKSFESFEEAKAFLPDFCLTSSRGVTGLCLKKNNSKIYGRALKNKCRPLHLRKLFWLFQIKVKILFQKKLCPLFKIAVDFFMLLKSIKILCGDIRRNCFSKK
jgi:hypothetical protein